MRHASIGWEAKEERRCAAAEPRNPSITPIYRILQSTSHGVGQVTGEGEDGGGTRWWDGPTMAGFGLVGDVDQIPCFIDEKACWFDRAMGQLFFMGKSRSFLLPVYLWGTEIWLFREVKCWLRNSSGWEGTEVTPQIRTLIEDHHLGAILLTTKNLKSILYIP